MPEISRFYGIVISIRFADHHPPHFYAKYEGNRVAIDIRSLAVMRGSISARGLGLVIEWASIHQAELMEDWELASAGRPVRKIEPLR